MPSKRKLEVVGERAYSYFFPLSLKGLLKAGNAVDDRSFVNLLNEKNVAILPELMQHLTAMQKKPLGEADPIVNYLSGVDKNAPNYDAILDFFKVHVASGEESAFVDLNVVLGKYSSATEFAKSHGIDHDILPFLENRDEARTMKYCTNVLLDSATKDDDDERRSACMTAFIGSWARAKNREDKELLLSSLAASGFLWDAAVLAKLYADNLNKEFVDKIWDLAKTSFNIISAQPTCSPAPMPSFKYEELTVSTLIPQYCHLRLALRENELLPALQRHLAEFKLTMSVRRLLLFAIMSNFPELPVLVQDIEENFKDKYRFFSSGSEFVFATIVQMICDVYATLKNDGRPRQYILKPSKVDLDSAFETNKNETGAMLAMLNHWDNLFTYKLETFQEPETQQIFHSGGKALLSSMEFSRGEISNTEQIVIQFAMELCQQILDALCGESVNKEKLVKLANEISDNFLKEKKRCLFADKLSFTYRNDVCSKVATKVVALFDHDDARHLIAMPKEDRLESVLTSTANVHVRPPAKFIATDGTADFFANAWHAPKNDAPASGVDEVDCAPRNNLGGSDSLNMTSSLRVTANSTVDDDPKPVGDIIPTQQLTVTPVAPAVLPVRSSSPQYQFGGFVEETDSTFGKFTDEQCYGGQDRRGGGRGGSCGGPFRGGRGDFRGGRGDFRGGRGDFRGGRGDFRGGRGRGHF